MNALADAILAAHFAFVLFVAGGFALILAGAARSWRWVRNRRFRIAHLAAIALVAAESVAGIACPLTVWEDALRRAAIEERGFLSRWIARLLYYDFPEWMFTAAYCAFAAAVALAWRLIPPTIAPGDATPGSAAPGDVARSNIPPRSANP